MIEEPRDSGWYSGRLFFLIAAAFVASAPVFWRGVENHPEATAAAYENADLYQEIYPGYHYGFERMRHGELPLWNSKQLCGTPFLANPAFGVFQPLNVVFAFLPTEQALPVHAFMALTLMGVGFALFARALGTGYAPALVGAVAYAFCGASAAAVSRPAQANALAWAPLMFWGIRECARRLRPSAALVAGLAAALVVLSGAGALSAAMLGAGLAYAAYSSVLPGGVRSPGVLQRAECLLVMVLAAAGVSAIQWLPTLAWAWTLDKPGEALLAAGAAPGQFPASLRDLVAQLLVPKASALPRVGYLGVAALLAIPAAALHRRTWRDGLFFAAAGIAALWAACGGSGVLPAFPGREYALFPGMFCLSALAALGYDRLLAPKPGRARPQAWAPAAMVLTCAAALFYVSTSESRGRIVVFAILLLPAALIRRRWSSAVCGAAFALLLFIDLASATTNLYRHPSADAPACYRQYPAAVAVAEEQALGARALVSAPILDFGLPANLGMVFPSLAGADGTWPLTKDQTLWWRRLGLAEGAPPEKAPRGSVVTPQAETPNLLNIMSARVVLAAPEGALYAGAWTRPGPRLREIKTKDDARVFVNDLALPRAAWVPAWRAVEGIAKATDVLGAPEFDGLRECAIDRDSEGYARVISTVGEPRPADSGPPPAPPPGVQCAVEDPSPERVVVRTSAPQAGFAVLADTWAPGWKATLDNVPAPILRANGLFRAIATPPGDHVIAFTYRPRSFQMGATISLATLGAMLFLGFWKVLRA